MADLHQQYNLTGNFKQENLIPQSVIFNYWSQSVNPNQLNAGSVNSIVTFLQKMIVKTTANGRLMPIFSYNSNTIYLSDGSGNNPASAVNGDWIFNYNSHGDSAYYRDGVWHATGFQ